MNGTGRLATMPAREPRRPLNGRLCSLLVNYDTYDHTFRLCQHPLVCQARAESDALLLTTPLLMDLDRRLFPTLLRLVQEEDGHSVCMGNWNTSQITQLDQVIRSTDSVPALSESLLALSKHSVNRIDFIWDARQQAAYHTALSRTPEADPVLLRTLQRRFCRIPKI